MKRFILVLAFTVSACANPKHTVVVLDNSLYEVLNDVFVTEQTLLRANAPGWDTRKSEDFNRRLLPAVNAGRQLNTLLSNWKAGDPIPQQIHDAITGITEALRQVSTDLPAGNLREKIVSDLANAEAIVLNILNLVLTMKG